MADNGRWFKLWCSCVQDPSLDNLPIADFGRWAKLGAIIKEQGTNGVLIVSDPSRLLCAALQLPSFSALISCIQTFPNVTVTPVTNGNVTFKIEYGNWWKYQGDFSGDRVKRHRAKVRESVTPKKRGEEKRGDEKREVHKTLVPVVDTSTPWTDTLDDVRRFLLEIKAPEEFFNQAYWLRIDQWLGANAQVAYFDELKAYLAWHASQNGHAKHKDLLRGFRNWLSTSARWKERDAAKHAVYTRNAGR